MQKDVGSRQQPGYACDECRKKRLRCDRQRPQCGACASAGIPCKANDRRTLRPAENASIETIRGRMDKLERHLSKLQTPANVSDEIMPSQDSSHGKRHYLEPSLSSSPAQQRKTSGVFEPSPGTFSFTNSNISYSNPVLPAVPYDLSRSECPPITDLMKINLTQLYFERVHTIVPMLNRPRACRLGIESGTMNEYRQCLQYAMWTLATAFSSEFGNIQNLLYIRTRSALEALDMKEVDLRPSPIEQVQAWILLTFYEFTKCPYQRAWLSAGRAFRLVHLAKLYNVDKAMQQTPNDLVIDPVEKEERRRTFWVAFSLDRIISVSNGFPMTLMEDIVCTRLPCSDTEFDSGATSPSPFLSEVIASAEPQNISPFIECIVLITICGRAMAHKQVTDVETLYGKAPMEFSERHNWLDSLVTNRLQNLSTNYPLSSITRDPMIMFTHLLARVAIIYLTSIMEPLTKNINTLSVVWTQENRGVWAAQEISRLAGEFEHLSYFKAHIFLPLPFYLSAVKLRSHLEKCKIQLQAELGLSHVHDLEECLNASVDALRELRLVTNLGTYYLHLFESINTTDICAIIGPS